MVNAVGSGRTRLGVAEVLPQKRWVEPGLGWILCHMGLSYREVEPRADLLCLSLFLVVTGATDGIGKSYAEEVSRPRRSPHLNAVTHGCARLHKCTPVSCTFGS